MTPENEKLAKQYLLLRNVDFGFSLFYFCIGAFMSIQQPFWGSVAMTFEIFIPIISNLQYQAKINALNMEENNE